MMRFVRRQYLIGSVVALGSVVAAACDLGAAPPPEAESPPPADTAPPPRRAPIASLPTPHPGSVPIHVLFGPYEGLVYSETPHTYYTTDWKVVTPQQELYRTMVSPTFQDRYPDHHVTFDTHHDPLPVVLAAHAAGQAPDLFLADDRRGRAVVQQGLAARLDGRVRQWPDHADFVRPALAAGQYDRQQWGLPLFTQVYTLYYNQALLKALGLLRLPTTWEDLLAAADQSTKVEGHHVVRQGVNGPDPSWFMWLLQSTGATLYEAGQAGFGGEAEEILLFLRHLYHAVHPWGVEPLYEGMLLPSGAEHYAYTKYLWETGQVAHAWLPALPRLTPEEASRHASKVWERLDTPPDPQATPLPPTLRINAGELATARALWEQAPPPGDIAVGRLPAPGKQYALPDSRQVKPLIYTHSGVLHLSAQSEHPDVAWELLTLFLEPVTLHEYTNVRRAIPPRRSILGLGYLDHPKTQQVIDLWLRYGRPPFDPPEYAQVSNAIGKTFQDTVVWQQDLGKGVDDLIVQLNKIAAEATPPFTGTTRA